MAACSSTPSNPAAIAFRAAATKSSTVAAMSASVIARGVGWSSMPSLVKIRPPDAIADGAMGSAPSG